MIEHRGALSLARQCALLGVSRSSQYYAPSGESAGNLALMRRMDELHLAHPFYGSRQMARHLRREGVVAGRQRGCWRRARAAPWTGAAGTSTTSSSSACGVR